MVLLSKVQIPLFASFEAQNFQHEIGKAKSLEANDIVVHGIRQFTPFL